MRLRDVCEFHHFACTTMPGYYSCNGSNLTLLYNINDTCGGHLEWGAQYVNKACDDSKLTSSWMLLVPLPLLLVRRRRRWTECDTAGRAGTSPAL